VTSFFPRLARHFAAIVLVFFHAFTFRNIMPSLSGTAPTSSSPVLSSAQLLMRLSQLSLTVPLMIDRSNSFKTTYTSAMRNGPKHLNVNLWGYDFPSFVSCNSTSSSQANGVIQIRWETCMRSRSHWLPGPAPPGSSPSMRANEEACIKCLVLLPMPSHLVG
jgi:hypothetical protein